jgi:uncharacterized membrane protein
MSLNNFLILVRIVGLVLFKDIRTKQVIQKVKKVAKKKTQQKTNAMRMVEQL